MPELRKDYILDRYVIIATERAKRPDQFRTENKEDKPTTCFFCPGNENMTPPEIMRFPGVGDWQVRVFENKFAAVGQGERKDLATDNDFFTYADAVGRHEVVVETNDHARTVWDLTIHEMRLVIDAYIQRIAEIEKLPGVRYVQIFKNHGKEAGTSIQHTHTQIIGYNLVPSVIEDEEKKCGDDCKYCRIIEIEKGSDRRIYQNSTWASFAPYASRFPFEAWLFPKRHVRRLDELGSQEKDDLCDALLYILRKLKELNSPYNYAIHYGIKNLHLHIEVMPRLATWAGFELGTGTIINSMPPEKAALFYRQAL